MSDDTTPDTAWSLDSAVLILSMVVAIPAVIVAAGIVWLDDRYLSGDADRIEVIKSI